MLLNITPAIENGDLRVSLLKKKHTGIYSRLDHYLFCEFWVHFLCYCCVSLLYWYTTI